MDTRCSTEEIETRRKLLELVKAVLETTNHDDVALDLSDYVSDELVPLARRALERHTN